ncbi:protein singles bar [Lepeophtheirus salmonis]|nr:protein singles bar-like [Lepeophtheirus salmonis]
MGGQRIRTIYMSPEGRRTGRSPGERGFKCCFGICRIGTCNSKDFFGNPSGIIKIFEVAIALVCQFLLLKYGVKYAEGLGFSYHLILSVTSASFLTNTVLTIIYATSHPSKIHIKSSIFELVFNFVLCSLYLGISPLFAKNVHSHLFYYFNTIPNFTAYPTLTASYILGFIAGVIHGIDGFLSLRDYRKYN